MKIKRIVLSFISLVFSLLLFITATFAWFLINQTVENDNISVTVDPGIITNLEITYYTLDNIFKYDKTSESIKVWNDSLKTWDAPSYSSPEDTGYTFSGIMMQQYDPMIPINNTFNHIIIELKLEYDVDSDTFASITAISSRSIADYAKTIFNLNASKYYYLSEVINIQRLDTLAYSSTPEGTNIYIDLTNEFKSVDIYGDLVYPTNNFYDDFGIYKDNIEFTNLNFSSTTSPGQMIIYFNLSYYEDKVLSILSSENAGSTIGTLPYIRFFQDIVFKIQEVGA